MMKRIPLMIFVLGVLSACISGTHPTDSYVGQDGKVTRIESDSEMCNRECNQDYSRCMDTRAANDNSGVIGPSGVFGASGDCRRELQNCLPGCKGQ